MKRVLGLVTASLAVVISGCGSDPIRPTRTVTFPTVGTVVTRSVGEHLLEKGTGKIVPDLYLEEDLTLGKYRLPQGHYEYDEEDEVGIWFDGWDEEDFYMRKADGQLCVEDTNLCAPANYTLNKRFAPTGEESFQQTLLYNGKIGNKITLAYREFFRGHARPAFRNSVAYDLSASNVVGYKGARLEIIKATNTEITYKVLSGFVN